MAIFHRWQKYHTKSSEGKQDVDKCRNTNEFIQMNEGKHRVIEASLGEKEREREKSED